MSRLKILAVGDPHFMKNNARDTDALHQRVIEIIESEAPDCVVVLGDTLNDFEVINSATQQRAQRFLKDISDRSELLLLIGNHDIMSNNEVCSEVHPFWALKAWKNTVVADHPIALTRRGVPIVLVPYVPKGKLLSVLREHNIDPAEACCVFAHQEMRGCKMGAIVSEDGDEWEASLPLMVSGHEHTCQRPQPNIFYPGTPLQLGWADAPKRALSLLRISRRPAKSQQRKNGDFCFSHNGSCITKRSVSVPNVEKRVETVAASALSETVLKKGVRYKVKVVGTSEEIKRSFKSKKVAQWRKEGHLVTREVLAVAPSTYELSRRHESFHAALSSRLTDEVQLRALAVSLKILES